MRNKKKPLLCSNLNARCSPYKVVTSFSNNLFRGKKEKRKSLLTQQENVNE